MELRHLRCFLAIAEHGNITRAAQRLHISQPALSRTLAQLERELAVHLVDRSTHHLTLTEAGSRFAITAKAAVERVDEAIDGIVDTVPPIRFGHNWSSATHAAAIMRRWKAEHPTRQLRSERNNERVAGLLDGHVDVALVRGRVVGRAFHSTVIDNEPRMAVVPASHPLARRVDVSLADLATETLIVSSTTGSDAAIQVTDSGLAQSISLVTGKPAADKLARISAFFFGSSRSVSQSPRFWS